MRRSRWIVRMSAVAALCGLAAGCGAASDKNADTLKIGAYSVVQEAFHDGLLPAFAAEWKRRTGREVVFEESYNGSGAPERDRSRRDSTPTSRSSRSTGDMDGPGQGRAGQARLGRGAGQGHHHAGASS